MKIKLLIAGIVFAISMFCGLVIVANGLLAGRFNSMYPYTAKSVCEDGEKLVLTTDSNTTTGTLVIDNTVYTNAAFAENTLYCVNETSGSQRDVTNETYDAFEKLRGRIGWWVTIGLFLVTMILILVFERTIIRRIDRVTGYQSTNGK